MPDTSALHVKSPYVTKTPFIELGWLAHIMGISEPTAISTLRYLSKKDPSFGQVAEANPFFLLTFAQYLTVLRTWKEHKDLIGVPLNAFERQVYLIKVNNLYAVTISREDTGEHKQYMWSSIDNLLRINQLTFRAGVTINVVCQLYSGANFEVVEKFIIDCIEPCYQYGTWFNLKPETIELLKEEVSKFTHSTEFVKELQHV